MQQGRNLKTRKQAVNNPHPRPRAPPLSLLPNKQKNTRITKYLIT